MPQPSDLFHLTRHLPTPLLVIDQAQVCANIGQLRQALPAVELFYAVKCNAHPHVLAAVQQMEAGFEIASLSEAATVRRMGVAPERIICLHPIKAPEFLRYLHRHQIGVLAADSRAELDKLAAHAPHSRIVLRLNVANTGSVFPLSNKFGSAPEEALGLLSYARERGLQPHGLTIHVGSQCERAATWTEALHVCRQVWRDAHRAGFALKLLSLGGGLPAPYAPEGLTAAQVALTIRTALENFALPTGCALSIEPGRALVANAGTLIASVVGLAERQNGSWAYLDAGVYHGLFEACAAGGGLPFQLSTNQPGRPPMLYNLGGPTCDGFDMPFERRALPELRLGDRVAIHTAGAYSTELSSTFNGFPAPTVYGLEELQQ
ncbi:MAG: type III PLP-dependent enzyme [Acidobacteria bacterium]|nr:type III PLP-dependent enzyme [Acidobacteriota bacterium]MBI3423642.1 type III PLP-dependent enzyme [Acidobacteriota bacterium]